MSFHPSKDAAAGADASTPAPKKRTTRLHHLQKWKEEGTPWAMLTAYDYSSAAAFEDAGIPVLLVGDSAANTVYGLDTTAPVTVDELLPLVRGVVRGAPHALVVADLPFGSYEVSTEQALTTAFRFMKEGGAHAVKIEGGVQKAATIRALVEAGIPVMAHVGFTPQHVNALGGFRVQGRGDSGAEKLLADARAVEEAGAFSVVMEMVPADIAKTATEELSIPTIGIGGGVHTDAQVLVWQDMMGMTPGRKPRFVKVYAEVGATMREAAARYRAEVEARTFPTPEHSF
ncbi:3-methyl-2-oxobutanoate hydroxymethyltransferase [Brevibacterium litoralis]|uniref:3-methyl-2-oxobutanoate hydroxymethyltransferase n=1 Tax=Brevibacterium litoralis TaxID=3138935 RepID=UPI0032EBACC7